MWYETILEKNLVPDPLLRFGMRRMLGEKLRKESAGGIELQQARLSQLIQGLKNSPIAINTADANTQHYEVPAEFFELVLGKYLKYSGCYWTEGIQGLDEAEKAMLDLYCERAKIVDGQDILELGCGWGSLSLYLAERFPACRILGVSNSSVQRQFIQKRMEARKIKNLEILTADMNVFETPRRFDRVVSIEMFEHMRNYEKLFEKVSGWMKPEAFLFIHVFSHGRFAYPYETKDKGNWMARYFFTGGMMPSDELFLFFQKDLKIRDRWRVDGTHYQKTSEAWLSKMDANREKIMAIFKQTYGEKEALKWWVYWRVFFMACAECFGFSGGQEWLVSHYLFEKKAGSGQNGRE